MSNEKPTLVPSVKVISKQNKITEGTGDTKKTTFKTTWDYEYFQPMDGVSDKVMKMKTINNWIIEARQHAQEEEARK